MKLIDSDPTRIILKHDGQTLVVDKSAIIERNSPIGIYIDCNMKAHSIQPDSTYGRLILECILSTV